VRRRRGRVPAGDGPGRVPRNPLASIEGSRGGAPMTELSGKPIAITGASSGIGMVTALYCARAGMPVVVGARREDRLRGLVAGTRGEGGRAVAVACDVDRPEDCHGLVDATVREFGSIYSVFANAGYGTYTPVHEMSDADVRAMFQTNFYGTLATI